MEYFEERKKEGKENVAKKKIGCGAGEGQHLLTRNLALSRPNTGYQGDRRDGGRYDYGSSW